MPLTHNIPDVIADLASEYESIEEAKRDLVITVGLETHADLMRMSPVLFGTYRNSHILTINEPSDEIPVAHKNRSSKPEGAVLVGNLNESERRLKQLPENLDGSTVHIVNNQPYAGPIEHGHSKQAPQGVYARAELNAQHTIDEIRREVGL